MKCSIKKKSDAIKQLEEELEGIDNFQSQSEHQFIKVLPRGCLKLILNIKRTDQNSFVILEYCVSFLVAKFPKKLQMIPNIAKCKRTLQDEVGDVGSSASQNKNEPKQAETLPNSMLL